MLSVDICVSVRARGSARWGWALTVLAALWAAACTRVWVGVWAGRGACAAPRGARASREWQ